MATPEKGKAVRRRRRRERERENKAAAMLLSQSRHAPPSEAMDVFDPGLTGSSWDSSWPPALPSTIIVFVECPTQQILEKAEEEPVFT